ncbi:hypothetical protein [Fredinandcohnia sp. 179-A 10B2 NHS]|uniref:hypothetical protein n=1 Tax=Fredinandcohnia sp. 179-A 10B2 NHS TaxID=3235176 RepID=UPI0039A11DF0
MKKLLGILSVLFVLLVGCSDPVQEEFLTYINDDMSALAELEMQAVSAYDSVTGANYTDDYTVYMALTEEIVPQYLLFIDGLEAIKPESEEIRSLHEQYIEAANIQHGAFTKLIFAIENQDAGEINEVNEMLATARKMMRDYEYEINKLAEEYDVEITKITDNNL